MKLTGNTILITGGTSGIGLEFTRVLLELGNSVIITGRDQGRMDAAKKKYPRLNVIASDVSQPKEIEKLAATLQKDFPKVNWLINNAGVMNTISFQSAKGSLEEVTKEIEINLMGPIRMAKQFIPILKGKENACIVNVTSGLAFVPLPTSPVYCATKAGLHSFSLSLRVQLKKSGVKVFEVAPPATETPLLSDFKEEDRKGISIMKVEDMVADAVKGIGKDLYEICPGQSKQLRLMSRVAPAFMLTQLSRRVEQMLADAGI